MKRARSVWKFEVAGRTGGALIRREDENNGQISASRSSSKSEGVPAPNRNKGRVEDV
jgi:hypothetical protein